LANLHKLSPYHLMMWGGKIFPEYFIFLRNISGDNFLENVQYFSNNIIVDINKNNVS